MGAVLVAHGDKQSREDQPHKRTDPGQHQLSIQQWSDVCRKMKMSLREQNICKLLFDGLTRQKIAEQMGISDRTVRHHMEQIHLKLDVSNRVGVVLKIIRTRDLLDSAPLISSHIEPSSYNRMSARAKGPQQPEA